MKAHTIIVLGILAASFSIAQAAAEPAVSKETAMKAIATFQKETNPFAPDARSAGDVVQQFAQDSHEVLIKISPRAVPILNAKNLSEEERNLLVQAFVVGNVNAQLTKGHKGDEAYAGDKQMIETYHRMQQIRPNLRVPEIEILADFEAKDQLQTYLSLEDSQ